MTRTRLLPRRVGVAGFALLAIIPAAAHAFDFEEVAHRAQQLAAQPYRPQKVELPKELQGIDYDHYRDIRFRPDRMLWRDAKLPFEIAFFHMGLYFDQPVRVNEIDGNTVRQVRFDPSMFDYGSNRFDPQRMSGLGFAGFRVHYALNTPKYKDEVLVFLGASYFRALGKGQVYGISARGLAIDTGLASGEEFPRFVEFWLERPAANASELTIYALLDSRRASGAYRFVLRPGTETAMDIRERLFLRENVSRLGIAPLTTMYFFGENQPSKRDDYRPEVHDSDGLSIHSGTGEWIWRPLVNPKRLLVTSFALTNPVGFGLMQRDRDFEHYEDLEARYDLRPSAWVQPKGKWGAGRVELVEIPSPDETNDNIVAYWVPEVSPAPGVPLDLEYRLLWQGENMTRPPSAWVSQTRRGRGYTRNDDGSIGMVVDFEGPALRKLPADTTVEGDVTVDANAKVREVLTQRNDVTGGWRLVLRFARVDAAKPLELRAYLRTRTGTLSETWSYVLPPD
ncbi:MAG TPA: glucan biosynthesis protein G [Casimicrobiaceae bacterium]|nr:glucan biosynthesis protein G [Casimicrobiaceae bacterium]